MLIKPPERTKNGFEQRRALDLILLAYYFFAFIGVNPTDAEVPIFENGLIYLVYAASAVLCVVSLSLSSSSDISFTIIKPQEVDESSKSADKAAAASFFSVILVNNLTSKNYLCNYTIFEQCLQ